MQGEQYFVDHPKHLAFLVAIKKVKPVDVKAEAAQRAADEARKKAQSEAAKKAAATRRRNQRAGKYEKKIVFKAPETK